MRFAKLAALVILLLTTSAASAITVKKRTEAPGLPDQIWSAVGQFCAIGLWHPGVASCEESHEGGSTYRTLTLKDGNKIKEKLSSAEAVGYTFEIIESSLPVKNYRSKLWLEVDDEPDRTVILWQSEFSANGASAAEAQKTIADLLYAGIKGIKRIALALQDGQDPSTLVTQIPTAPKQEPTPPAITHKPSSTPNVVQSPETQTQSAVGLPAGSTPQVLNPAPALSPSFAPDAGRRIALVVGNDDYESLPDLRKAVNDARAVGTALSKLGFEVMPVENAPRRTMNAKLVEFTSKIEPGDTALFFFAGHGVQIKGINYLLPIDTPNAVEGQEALITGEGIPADSVVQQAQDRGAKVAMLVLDACRDNPFKTSVQRGIGGTRGLTMMRVPTGVFVLYSAGEGQAALDRLGDNDPNPNSVFTRTFVEVLGHPGLTLHDIAKKTQLEVFTLAQTIGHTQFPAYDDRIIGELTLYPGN
jgi:hypothetical protein